MRNSLLVFALIGRRPVITMPGKVSGSRRFYVIIRGTAWSGGSGGDGDR
jgi:hypothetical protein